MQIRPRQVHARNLFPIVDTLTSITAYRRKLYALLPYVCVCGMWYVSNVSPSRTCNDVCARETMAFFSFFFFAFFLFFFFCLF